MHYQNNINILIIMLIWVLIYIGATGSHPQSICWISLSARQAKTLPGQGNISLHLDTENPTIFAQSGRCFMWGKHPIWCM